MSVPEASVDENDRLMARKYQIRAPGQIPPVQLVPKSKRMQRAPQKHLRLCIFRPDATHVQPPLLTRKNVCHKYSRLALLSWPSASLRYCPSRTTPFCYRINVIDRILICCSRVSRFIRLPVGNLVKEVLITNLGT